MITHSLNYPPERLHKECSKLNDPLEWINNHECSTLNYPLKWCSGINLRLKHYWNGVIQNKPKDNHSYYGIYETEHVYGTKK